MSGKERVCANIVQILSENNKVELIQPPFLLEITTSLGDRNFSAPL